MILVIFSAKRNLKRHFKNVHKTQDESTNSNHDNDDNNSNQRNDPFTDMVERAEIIIPSKMEVAPPCNKTKDQQSN